MLYLSKDSRNVPSILNPAISNNLITGKLSLLVKAVIRSNSSSSKQYLRIIQIASKICPPPQYFGDKPIPISNAKHGNGIVIGYTVLYEGTKPTSGVFYIEDSQGERKVVTSEDKAVITSMREEEWIEKEISFYGNQVS